MKTATRRGGASLKDMKRPPTHPGEMFEEEFRKPSGISQAEAARRMGISANRLNEIVKEKRGVTPETAVLFGLLTRTTPQYRRLMYKMLTFSVCRTRAKPVCC